MKCWIRERRCVCGRTRRAAQHQEVDIFLRAEGEAFDRELTESFKKASSEKQLRQNARRARDHFRRLINTNFDENDLHLGCTYTDETLPETEQQAEKDLNLFLGHLRAACKKQGLPRPEYLAVTEWQDEDKSTRTKAVRYHHHVILRCGLTRDAVEACWSRRSERLGTCNADRLQQGTDGIEAISNYLLKYTNRKHRWKRSRGIKDPILPPPNDNRYTKRKLTRICTDGTVQDAEFWEKQYPGWKFGRVETKYDDWMGWRVRVFLTRQPPGRKKHEQKATPPS